MNKTASSIKIEEGIHSINRIGQQIEKHDRVLNTFSIRNSFLLCFLFVFLCFSYLLADNSKLVVDAPVTSKDKKISGYLIAGISFSVVGGACIVTSIPFLKYANTPSTDDIGQGIAGLTGAILLGSGVLFELTSIPFYVKHHKTMTNNNVSIIFSPTSLSVACEF